jgi:hypothetical protein
MQKHIALAILSAHTAFGIKIAEEPCTYACWIGPMPPAAGLPGCSYSCWMGPAPKSDTTHTAPAPIMTPAPVYDCNMVCWNGPMPPAAGLPGCS